MGGFTFREPREGGLSDTQDWWHLSSLSHKILDAKSHADLGALVGHELQRFVQHEALVVIWGNFRLGVLHYDLLTTVPELHAEGVEGAGMTPEFGMLFQQWLAMGRKPLRLDARGLSVAWTHSGLADPAARWLMGMSGVVLQGIQDQRGSNDALYAFFSREAHPPSDDDQALKFIVPLLDVAIRQVESPARSVQAETSRMPAQDQLPDDGQSDELSEREAEIMKWVAMGKTNLEIGSILNLSSFTVKNHMQRIFKKLDVFNRAQAVSVYKAQHGTKP